MSGIAAAIVVEAFTLLVSVATNFLFVGLILIGIPVSADTRLKG